MKKIYMILAAVCIMTVSLNAQKLYIRAGLGGGVGLKQYASTMWSDESQTASSDNFVIKSVGLGGGFNVNAAFGYNLSDNVGAELGINEFIGLAKKTHSTNDNSSSSLTIDNKISGMMLQIVPAVVINAGLEKINPYARLGMIVGVLPSITIDSKSSSTSSGASRASSSQDFKIKLSGGVAVGFTAAGGVTYNISDMLSLYGELVYNGIAYSPAKGIYKKYIVDDVDKLATMTTKEKETKFVKKFDADEKISDDSPSKTPKVSFTFSDVLLNVGVMIKL